MGCACDVAWCHTHCHQVRQELLPNVGRETHSYLTYIVEHYDSLPPAIVFTQGDPFPHNPDFLEEARRGRDDVVYTDLVYSSLGSNGRLPRGGETR